MPGHLLIRCRTAAQHFWGMCCLFSVLTQVLLGRLITRAAIGERLAMQSKRKLVLEQLALGSGQRDKIGVQQVRLFASHARSLQGLYVSWWANCYLRD